MTRRRMWWMLLSIVAAATQKRTKAAEKPQLVFDLRGYSQYTIRLDDEMITLTPEQVFAVLRGE